MTAVPRPVTWARDGLDPINRVFLPRADTRDAITSGEFLADFGATRRAAMIEAGDAVTKPSERKPTTRRKVRAE